MDLDAVIAALAPVDAPRLARALEGPLGAEVVGLLMYGSRARGEETPRSDWDILAVTAGPSEGLRRSHRGVDLDIDARAVDALRPSADLVYLLPGRVLLDSENRLAAFLEGLEACRALGPAPLTEAERARWDAWVHRMLARIDENLEGDPVLAGWQMSWLHQELLGLWFAWRTQWQRGPRRDLAWLREHDAATWEAHAEVGRATTPRGRRDALEILVRRTVG